MLRIFSYLSRPLMWVKGVLYDLGDILRRVHNEAGMELEIVNPQADELILDAACGTGMSSLPLINRGSTVVGVDICAPFLHRFKAKICGNGSKTNLLLADVAHLPLRDGMFDKTICFDALHHIQTGAWKTVNEFLRILKSDAKIVFRDILKDRKGFHFYRLIDLTDFYYQEDMKLQESNPQKSYRRTYFSGKEYVGLLERIGFSNVRVVNDMQFLKFGTLYFVVARK